MEQDYLISNRTYDVLTRIVQIVLPGIAALYLSLADLWDLPNPTAVAGTLAAVATFGGVLLKFADVSWNKSEGKYDGEVGVTGLDPDTGMPDLQLIVKDPNVYGQKDFVRLKSFDKVA